MNVSDWHIRWADKLGDGNVSDGVRYAIEIAATTKEVRVTKNFSQLIPAVYGAYMKFGEAITEEQQQFVMSNWQTFVPFIQTEEGKIALQTFVEDWRKSTQTTQIK